MYADWNICEIATCFQSQIIGHTDTLVSQMVRWVSTVGFEVDIQARALGCLITIATLHKALLSGGMQFSIFLFVFDYISNYYPKAKMYAVKSVKLRIILTYY